MSFNRPVYAVLAGLISKLAELVRRLIGIVLCWRGQIHTLIRVVNFNLRIEFFYSNNVKNLKEELTFEKKQIKKYNKRYHTS